MTVAIANVIINVSDVSRSGDFYHRHLGGEFVGTPTTERAVLDFLSATVELRRVADPTANTWQEDDTILGFRHIAFKVASADAIADTLKADGARFRTIEFDGATLSFEPMDAPAGVRMAFFFDPDGTVLEIIQGDLRYDLVADPAEVAAERASGTPPRPRFDHVAVTVRDLDEALSLYTKLGFRHIGALLNNGEPRGFRIDYLRDGETVIEIFTFSVPTKRGSLQPNALGFRAAELTAPSGSVSGSGDLGEVEGHPVLVDVNDFAFILGR
jgi:catechol 2,3-dioxygenase-like lactoylglutathione lyase family enzyme